jgi:hypothetical protein
MEDVIKPRGFEGGRKSIEQLLDVVLQRLASSEVGITARREPGNDPGVLSLKPDELVVGGPALLRIARPS